MPNITANGIGLEYDTMGDPARPPVLLVMGLGAQMVHWPEEFCAALAERGFFVVRYDNRDVGLSAKIEDGPAPDIVAALGGDTRSAAYTLADMAADGAGLLEALGLPGAHVVGVSMGGMIAQHMAVHHPAQVQSLCSIMSAPTGVMADDPSTPEATSVLLRPPPGSREEAITQAVEAWRVIGSPGFPFEEERVRARAALAYDRCFYPQGTYRQLVAILASGDRRHSLAAVDVPTVVIHGDADPLVRPSWGQATAAAIPGAEMVMVKGMGHDLPEAAWPTIIDAVEANAAKAQPVPPLEQTR